MTKGSESGESRDARAVNQILSIVLQEAVVLELHCTRLFRTNFASWQLPAGARLRGLIRFYITTLTWLLERRSCCSGRFYSLVSSQQHRGSQKRCWLYEILMCICTFCTRSLGLLRCSVVVQNFNISVGFQKELNILLSFCTFVQSATSGTR